MNFKDFFNLNESYDNKIMKNSEAYKNILKIFNKHKIKVKNLMTIALKNQNYISVVPDLDLDNFSFECRINKISSLKKEDFLNLSVDFGKVFSVDSALILSEKLKSVALCLKELNDYLKNVDILEFYDPNDL